MFVTSLELRNVKSYGEATISFEPGTNIIAGGNGAGKTTIVEAIGYALFDHNPYKRKELLLRHGAKDGVITVTLVAGDEREYQVVRHIKRQNYYVYDPAHGTKEAEGKAEVMSWLSQNLGIGDEDGEEDLSSLFRNAVGVEQGLMTAPFLEAPEERRRKFTPLLKVEGYKRAAKEGVRLVNHIKDMMTVKRERIQWLKGRLQEFDEKLARERETKQQIAGLETGLQALRKQLEETTRRKEELDSKKKELEQKRTAREKEEALLVTMEDELKRAQRELDEAGKARDIIEETQEDHERFLKLEKILEALERQKKRVTHYQNELQEFERLISVKDRDIQHIEERMKEVRAAEKERDRLDPFLARERELTEKIEERRRVAGQAELGRQALRQLEEGLEEKRRTLEELESELAGLEQVTAEAGTLATVEEEMDRAGMKLAGILSKMEQELELKEKLSEGVCPFFEEACPKIGDDVLAFQERTESRVRGLKAELISHEERLEGLRQKKNGARKAKDRYHELLAKEEKARELKDIIAGDARKIEGKREELGEFEKAGKETTALEGHLRELREEAGHGQISGRWDVLSEKVKEKTKLEARGHTLESEKQELLKTKHETVARLQQFGDVERRTEEHRLMLDALKEPHYRFTRHERSARQFTTKEEAVSGLETGIAKKRATLSRLTTGQTALESAYDEEEHERVKAEHEQTRERFVTFDTELKEKRGYLRELSGKIEELREFEEEKKELRNDLKDDERLLHFVEYLREKVLKQIPDSLVRVYLEKIGREANRIFQELIGDPMTELRWSHDFEITVRDGENEKYFGQLSGGQQMCAALAVRLALLRSLSGVAIAFFDEPTQNLDGERRENLASSIRNIRGFHQLFIISHDETFHDLVENTIYLENEDGETRVRSGMI